MSISFDTIVSNQTVSASTTLTTPFTPNSAQNMCVLVVISFRGASGADVSANGCSVTYGGVQMCTVAGYPNSLTVVTATVETVTFGIIAPLTGTQSVVVTVPSAVQFRVSIMSWSGVQGFGSNNKGLSNTTGTTLIGPGACDSQVPGTVAVTTWASMDTSASWSAGTGTNRFTIAGTANLASVLIQDQLASGSTISPTATTPSSTTWVAYILTLIPTSSGVVTAINAPNLGTNTVNAQVLAVSGSSTTLANGSTLLSNVSITDNQTVAIVSVGYSLTTAAGTITTSVSYGGTAMTQLDLQQGAASGGNEALGIYYLFNPPVGATTVTLTVGGTTVKTFSRMSCTTYNNVASLGTTTNATGTSINPSTGAIPSIVGQRIIAQFVMGNNDNGGETTMRSNSGGAGTTGTGDFMLVQDTWGLPVSTTQTISMTASARWRVMSLPLNPAGVILYDSVGTFTFGSNITNGQSASWSHTAAGGPIGLVILCLSVLTQGSNSSVYTGYTRVATYGGNAMTSLGGIHQNNDPTLGWIEFFYIMNPPTGSQTAQISVTKSPAAGSLSIFANSVSYTGVVSIGALSTAAGNGAGTTESQTVNSLSGRTIVQAFGLDQANSMTYNQTARAVSTAIVIGDAPAASSVVFSSSRNSGRTWAGVAIELLLSSPSQFFPFF